MTSRVNEVLLRSLTPSVLGILVRRGADFAAAEDAVQDALVEAVRVWPADPPRDPKGWLVTVAWRKFLDAARADASRGRREVRVEGEPVPGPGAGSSSTSASRRRREVSARAASRNLRHATATNQALGSRGGASGHTRTASTRASWTASSAAAKSAPRRTRTPMAVGTTARSRASSTAVTP